MKEPIQGLWIGPRLSKLELMCVQSFLFHGHDFDLYVYDTIDNLPKHPRFRVLDANEILPKRNIFTYHSGYGKNSVSAFANWFRYELLQQRGGIYVDLDVLCLKPFDFDLEDYVMGWQDANLVNQAVLKLPKNSPLLGELIRLCRRPMRFLPWDTIGEKRGKIKRQILHPFDKGKQIWCFGYTGPLALTKFCQHLNLQSLAKEPEYFYPVGYEEVDLLLGPSEKLTNRITSKTYCVHLFNQALNRKLTSLSLDKDTFPEGSFLAESERRHLQSGFDQFSNTGIF